MRWRTSHHGHDPRQIDLLAVVVLFVLTVVAFNYVERHGVPPTTTAAALIEPSQNVRW